MPPKKKDQSRYHELLVELLHLREKDYDEFMNRMYEALCGEFREMVHDTAPIEEKQKALTTMMEHFAEKEEYEKCAELKKMSIELNPTQS